MRDPKRDAFNSAATARSVIVRLTAENAAVRRERDNAFLQVIELRRQRQEVADNAAHGEQEKTDEIPSL